MFDQHLGSDQMEFSICDGSDVSTRSGKARCSGPCPDRWPQCWLPATRSSRDMSGLAGGTQSGHACPEGLQPTHLSWPYCLFPSPEPSHPSQGPCSPCDRAYPRGCAHSPPRPVAPQRSHPLWKPYELEVGTRPKSEACQGAQQNPSPNPQQVLPALVGRQRMGGAQGSAVLCVRLCWLPA